MSTFKIQYSRLLRRYYDKTARPVWPPNLPDIQLGDYGHVVDEVFVPEGNLSDLGVSIKTIEDIDPDTLSVELGEGVNVVVKASGQTNASLPSIPQAKAGIGISFGREGAFTLHGEESFVPRLGNLAEIGSQLKKLREEKIWDTDWRVVTSFVRLTTGRFFLSQSSNSAVELTFDGTLTPSISELGKAGVSVEITAKRNAVYSLNPASNFTPIVHLHRLKAKFLGGSDFEPSRASSRTKPALQPIEFELEPDNGVEIDIDELSSY